MVSRDGIQLEHALALERLPLPHIIKVLMLQRHPLDKLRDHDSTDEERLAQCTAFMLACYNQNKCNSMSDARFKLWSSNRRTASAPKVKSLPPTGFAENIERAHFTVAQFRKATEPVLIPLQPTGWILEGEILNPTTVDRKWNTIWLNRALLLFLGEQPLHPMNSWNWSNVPVAVKPHVVLRDVVVVAPISSVQYSANAKRAMFAGTSLMRRTTGIIKRGRYIVPGRTLLTIIK